MTSKASVRKASLARGRGAAAKRGGAARANGGGEPIVVQFDDLGLVRDLLGHYDANLAVLEDRLGIEAVVNGNAWIPAPAVVAGSVIVYLINRGVGEVVIDERIYSIGDKAAMLVFRVFSVLIAMAGATLLALSQQGNHDLNQAGFTLIYSTCALVLFYFIAVIYYNRKLGGKE